MADPVTIGAAVGWGMKAVGWVVSPIISKLVSKGFSYLGFDASEKLKQLEIKVVQLELMLGQEAFEISPHRTRLEPLLKSLKSAFYEAEDILDDVEYHRLERQILSHPDDKLESDGMSPCKRNWVKKLQSALPKCSCLKNQESGNMSDDSPPDISKMEFDPDQVNFTNLRHIHIWTLSDLNVRNIIRLTSLQTLPDFRVRKEPGYELRQLRDLNKLRGRLRISGLGNVGSKEEALEANLASKERITKLGLYWPSLNVELWDWERLQSCSADLEAEILEGLCPPMGLETLLLWGYKGSRYPDWMVVNKNGPKHLQILALYGCSPLGAIPDRNEFFLHLRKLILSGCSWDALPDNMEHLTSLKELSILACMNLRSLATLPQSLESLTIHECNDVFTRLCETIGDPNWQKIEHVPKKIIQ